MKGIKYLIAAALLFGLQVEAKRAKVVEPEGAPEVTMSQVAPGGCECVTPTIELVDECVSVKKKACPVRFTTRSEWECVRTYEAGNNEDECVTTHNGEVVSTACDPCCKPCKPCCKPCRPCRPCRRSRCCR